MKYLKSTINIILFLTLPLWGGVFLFGLMIKDYFDGDSETRRAFRGERWMLE